MKAHERVRQQAQQVRERQRRRMKPRGHEDQANDLWKVERLALRAARMAARRRAQRRRMAEIAASAILAFLIGLFANELRQFFSGAELVALAVFIGLVGVYSLRPVRTSDKGRSERMLSHITTDLPRDELVGIVESAVTALDRQAPSYLVERLIEEAEERGAPGILVEELKDQQQLIEDARHEDLPEPVIDQFIEGARQKTASLVELVDSARNMDNKARSFILELTREEVETREYRRRRREEAVG